MAKKSISYGPNTALIAGEATARKYQSGSGGVSAAAFTAGFLSTYEAGVKEQKERDAIRDAYMADLGSIQNINLLDQDYNKQAVTDFVRAKRDEYSKLADAYSKTKDTDLLDKMDAIKFSFSNLNTQLNTLVTERASYLDSFDKGQLIDLPGDEKYTSIYTNKGQFSIEDNGDVGFTTDGKYDKFKDVAGKWNVKNNIGETLTMKTNSTAKQVGEQGGSFYRDDIKNTYTLSFKQTGPEGIMVMAKTDITGDNEFVLPNGQKAGNLSFEAMWSQGLLDDKFYTEFTKDGGSDWMWDKANSDKLNDLISEYYTDVTKSSYDQGKANYKDPNAIKGGGDNLGITDTIQGVDKGTWIKPGTARQLKRWILDGVNFNWGGTAFDYIDGAWHMDGEKAGNGTANDIVYHITNNEAFQGLKTEPKKFLDEEGKVVIPDVRAKDTASTIPGLEDVINMTKLTEGDDSVVTALNTAMPTQYAEGKNELGLKWDEGSGGLGDNPFYQEVQLEDGDGNLMFWPEGHEYDVLRAQFNVATPIRIRIKGEHRKKAIKMIDAALKAYGLAEYMKGGEPVL